MSPTVQSLQRRLISLGFPLPKYGMDGDPGSETVAAMNAALDELESRRWPTGNRPPVTLPSPTLPAPPIPADWMPAAKMGRVICHWTAGAHKASEFDRGHYHILIEDEGKLVCVFR